MVVRASQTRLSETSTTYVTAACNMIRPIRRGFNLIELVVVMAIISILLALLLPAVQSVREVAGRSHCQNNLKHLALAVHTFVDQYRSMPSYFGVFPGSIAGNNTSAPSSAGVPWGSWFMHLLPFVEQRHLYDLVYNDTINSGYNRPVYVGGSATTTTTTYEINGLTYTTTTVEYSGGQWQYHGIYIPKVKEALFHGLRCASDPSLPGHIHVAGWGPTNYLANWNAWGGSNGDGSSSFGPWDSQVPGQNYGWGHFSMPQRFAAIKDGVSNTILFGEGYAMCDRSFPRIALYSAHLHNFGITAGMNNGTVLGGTLLPPGTYDYPNGLPNTFMFQLQPEPTYCEGWRAQTPHSAFHVALVDSSVRSISGEVSPRVWALMMLPRDNQQVHSGM